MGNIFSTHHLEDYVEALESATEGLRKLKEDVSKRVASHERHQRKPLEQVQRWLSEAEAKISEVDEFMKESPCEIHNLWENDMFQMVAKRLEDVVALKCKGNFQLVVEKAFLKEKRVPQKAISKSKVGLETKMDEVWRWAMDEQVGIIGIYGIGGVGKTTLSKQVYRKFISTPNDFDIVIWVELSKYMVLESVLDRMWKTVRLFVDDDDDEEWVKKSFNEKAKSIHNVLCQNMFLLFLDDVWEKVDLITRLGVPLYSERQKGSTIVLTTRSESICRQMGAQQNIRMTPLAWEEAWKLFQQKVGKKILSNPETYNEAKLIAKRCSGLPILLVSTARRMANVRKRQEGLSVMQNSTASASEMSTNTKVLQFLDASVMSTKVLRVLVVSYDSLPNDLVKSCFLYCSLFPANYKLLKNDLIDFWILEEFLGHYDRTEEDAVLMGYEIIDTLIGACLLEEKENKYVKMQEFIHGMALWVSMASNSDILKHAWLFEAKDVENLQGAGRISTMKKPIHSLAKVPPDLLTAFLHYDPFVVTKGDFLRFTKTLTVLDFSNTCIEEVPRGISRLVSLQHLNLSHTWIEKLPHEMKALAGLKCLNLEHVDQLRFIPKEVISGLSSLRILRMFHCGFAVEEEEDNILSVNRMDINQLQRLKNLEVLSITITCLSALEDFFNTPKLSICTQALSLECFWGSKALNISPLAAMKHLVTLEIYQVERLKELEVDFMMNIGFGTLREVRVGSCSSLRELTWLFLAPNLEDLRVTFCEKMEEIISIGRLGEIQNAEENLNPFGKLNVLVLESLPKLKSIYWNSLPFRFLKKMEVFDCPLLKKLPLNSNSAKRNEVVIEAEENWWRDVEWEDDATKTAFLPGFKQKLID